MGAITFVRTAHGVAAGALLLGISLFTQGLTATKTDAATFALSRDAQGHPMLRLDGEIMSGDFARMRNALSGLAVDDRFSGTDDVTVLLNSPGGDLAEALLIARYVYRNGLATDVPAGARCLSACAIIFMHGSRRAQDGASSARRFLHPTGVLGFHAPYRASNTGLTGEQVRQTLTAYNRILGEALRLSGNRQFPKSLAAEMLVTPPEGIYLIDTLDKVGRWWIDLELEGAPRDITSQMARTACWNEANWGRDRFASGASQTQDLHVANDEPEVFVVEQGRSFRFTVRTGRFAENYCFVDFERVNGRVTSFRLGYNKTWGDNPSVPYWYLMPASLTLSQARTLASRW